MTLKVGDWILVPDPFTLKSPLKFVAQITSAPNSSNVLLASTTTHGVMGYMVEGVIPVGKNLTKAKLDMLLNLYSQEPYDQSKM